VARPLPEWPGRRRAGPGVAATARDPV